MSPDTIATVTRGQGYWTVHHLGHRYTRINDGDISSAADVHSDDFQVPKVTHRSWVALFTHCKREVHDCNAK